MANKTMIGLYFEQAAHREGFRFIAGVDEVGRGCLAGPVVAGAVILDISKPLPNGLNDSKKLSKKKRESLAIEIKREALAYSVGQIEAEEIDSINVLEATKKAMLSAIGNLDIEPDYLLIDALELRAANLPQKGIIRGDGVSASIAAASIIAKVFRDRLMNEYDKTFPQYGFAQHVGYGTKVHFEALRKYGAVEIHRKSFKGVIQPTLI